MGFDSATMSKAKLEAAIAQARRYPHKHFHKGELIISPEAYRTPGRETNLVISPFSILDCTGSIHIGPIAGKLITWISKFLATQRFLNLRTDELYY